MIQIRIVLESLHRRLKARASIEGMTLTDYLLVEMRRSANRLSSMELRERLNKRRPISPNISPAEAVRQERDLH